MAGTLSRALSTVLLVGAVTVLTGCTSTGVPAPPAETPVESATATAPSATPTPTETELPTDTGEPVDAACDELISPDTLYAYNPNISLTDEFDIEPGSDAAIITGDYQGLACQWVNDSSGEYFTVAVARLRDDTLESLKNDLVLSSNSVPTYGVEGYFQMEGVVGHADAFADPHWISIDSNYFLEPGDATVLVESIIAALG